MLFQNKWANLLLILSMIVIVSVVIVKKAKVLDATGKDTGNTLGFKAAA